MTYSFKAVIFDCDGVLVDTERLSNITWQTRLADIGLELSYDELHHHFTGYTTQANLEKATELLGRPLPGDFFQQVRKLFWEKMNDHLPVIPDIEETLEKIALPKATATNAQRKELDFKLQKTGLIRFFPHTVCCEDVEAPKPAPDVYLKAASYLGIEPEHCAVVEDSVAGIQAAVAAGMTAFGFSREMDAAKQLAAGAIRCFDNMKDLPDLLTG